MKLSKSQEILSKAINEWNPVALVALFSGGYDSMITTHVLHRLDTHGLPVQVWAIDTQLAADGWREYVQTVAAGFGWDFRIYDNKKGFEQYKQVVEYHGQPYSRKGHTYAYQRLKERGFDAIHMMQKAERSDKTLFASGVRYAESAARQSADEIARSGNSNKIFCAPIIQWTNEECDYYRVEYGLPDNPFYDTVKGSGDCQCNWGRFITYRMLKKHSPKLAAGNVAEIDRISRELHGYGWDGTLEGQTEMFEDFAGEAELTSPFLCAGCSRAKVRAPGRFVEKRYLQSELF